MNPSVPEGDPDLNGDLRRGLWTRPDPEFTGIHDIFDYALTFDAHGYAEDVLHAELHEYVKSFVKKWDGPERDQLGFIELRLLLSWEQGWACIAWQPGGCVRRSGDPGARNWDKSRPSEDDLHHFQDLYRATCEAWQREWPAVRDDLGITQ